MTTETKDPTPFWLFAIIGCLLMILGAYVRSKVWLWFLVPLGPPALSWRQCLGIFILYKSFFVSDKTSEITRLQILNKGFVNLVITITLAYLAHKL